jgi:hypothetical protein
MDRCRYIHIRMIFVCRGGRETNDMRGIAISQPGSMVFDPRVNFMGLAGLNTVMPVSGSVFFSSPRL